MPSFIYLTVMGSEKSQRITPMKSSTKVRCLSLAQNAADEYIHQLHAGYFTEQSDYRNLGYMILSGSKKTMVVPRHDHATVHLQTIKVHYVVLLCTVALQHQPTLQNFGTIFHCWLHHESMQKNQWQLSSGMHRDDGECLLLRRRRCGEDDRDRRRAISSFIFLAFCLALKNSNSPSFSHPSLHNVQHHATCCFICETLSMTLQYYLASYINIPNCH